MVTSNDTSSLDSLSKATTENGTVIIYSTSKLKSVSGCNGRVEGNKVIVSNVTENQTCNITIVPTLADTIKISYPPNEGRTDFTKIDNGTPGLYTGTDDQGTTYYFSGDGTNMNNWVRFAGKLWRIIRINGNGSVRLLYAGYGGEDGYIGSVQAYNTGGHPAYVGWKYTTGETLEASRGNKNKSNAYTTVENWYNELNSTDKNYIDLEAIYCNDRDIRSGSYSTSKPFYYTVYRRLAEGRNPVFTCGSTLDRFTTFGLITADEITYAGGNYGFVSTLAYYYLNANGGSSTGTNYWWTMSPFSFDTIGNAGSMVFKVNGSSGGAGMLALGSTGINDGVIRPVISIKSNVIVTNGDGSANSPYELSL